MLKTVLKSASGTSWTVQSICNLSSILHGNNNNSLKSFSLRSVSSISFEDLGILGSLIENLPALKVNQPAPIQVSAASAIFSGQNCAIQSYTGSGKTLGFLLPALTLSIQRDEKRSTEVARHYKNHIIQAAIITPSHELCMQITKVAKSVVPDGYKGRIQECGGHGNIQRQKKSIRHSHPVLVVGTPGRIMNFVREEILKLQRCPLVIIDEVDTLLAENFKEDIDRLSSQIGSGLRDIKRQTVIVSASLTANKLSAFKKWCPDPQLVTPQMQLKVPAVSSLSSEQLAVAHSLSSTSQLEVADVAMNGLPNPAVATATQPSTSPDVVPSLLPPGFKLKEEAPETKQLVLPPTLRHYYVIGKPDKKADRVRRIVAAVGMQKALVFMNQNRQMLNTMEQMQSRRLDITMLHGDLSNLERVNVLNAFRQGDFRTLLVSDLMSRGMDVEGVDGVINFEPPIKGTQYAHRAGRAGRMNAPGVVVTLVEKSDVRYMERLARSLGIVIREASLANRTLIVTKHLVGGESRSTSSIALEEGASKSPRQQQEEDSQLVTLHRDMDMLLQEFTGDLDRDELITLEAGRANLARGRVKSISTLEEDQSDSEDPDTQSDAQATVPEVQVPERQESRGDDLKHRNPIIGKTEVPMEDLASMRMQMTPEFLSVESLLAAYDRKGMSKKLSRKRKSLDTRDKEPPREEAVN